MVGIHKWSHSALRSDQVCPELGPTWATDDQRNRLESSSLFSSSLSSSLPSLSSVIILVIENLDQLGQQITNATSWSHHRQCLQSSYLLSLSYVIIIVVVVIVIVIVIIALITWTTLRRQFEELRARKQTNIFTLPLIFRYVYASKDLPKNINIYSHFLHRVLSF